MKNKNTTNRKYILVTLSHTEKRQVSPIMALDRIRKKFQCVAVVIAQETHNTQGIHYHIAIISKNASKNNATRIIRSIFPEFEGRQCEVRYHKGWGTMCTYVTKEDKEPLVWGEYTKNDILSVAENTKKKRKNTITPPRVIIEKIEKCEEWIDVYQDEILKEKLLTAYSNMRRIHEDMELIKMRRTSIGEKIVEYLNEKKWPEEYTPEEIKEKYILIDWVACQLAFQRPIKTKQLFIYGEPSTQKTLILNFIAKVLRVYFASSRINDFAGADNYYDLWVFDEFHEPEDTTGYTYDRMSTDASAYANTLLKVLDGQECRLDSKYGKIYNKKVNVPVIMVANKLTRRIREKGPMQERFIRMRFITNIQEIQEERIIATLWGCIKRRVCMNIQNQDNQEGNTKVDMNIKYNNAIMVRQLRRDERKFQSCTIEGEQMTGKKEQDTYYQRERGIQNLFKNNYTYWKIEIKEEHIRGEILSLINFAIIPLNKRPEEKKQNVNTEEKLGVFDDEREGADFTIYRNYQNEEKDCIMWPIYAQNIAKKKGESITIKLTLKKKIAQDTEEEEEETQEEEEKKEEKKEKKMWKLYLGPLGENPGKWDEED